MSTGTIGKESKVTVKVERFGSGKEDAQFEKYDKRSESHIRKSFRLPPIFLGLCHSADTEYLTEVGWRRYEDVSEGVHLASWRNGKIVFEVPLKRHAHPYKGDLVHIKNKGLNALVTPNHRMLARPLAQRGRVRDWDFVRADELIGIRGGIARRIQLPVSGEFKGTETSTFTLPANHRTNRWEPGMPTKNPTRDLERHAVSMIVDRARDVDMDAFVAFLGYFVTEGSTTAVRGPINLSQNPGPVADDMIAVLKVMGFSPGVNDDGRGCLAICVCHGGLWQWLRENCGVNSSSQRLPGFVLALSKRQRAICLDAMVAGDGHRPKLGSPGSFQFGVISRVLAEQIQTLACLSGMAATFRHDVALKERWSDTFHVYAHRGQAHSLEASVHLQPQPYDGIVCCFTMPSGTLVTRRNGRVLVSGA